MSGSPHALVDFHTGPLSEIVGEFDYMALNNKTMGLSAMPPCLPHADAAAPLSVPHSFCQRNGGVIFMRDGAVDIVREWRNLFEILHSSDGVHVRDQFSLRPTLWRHREQLRDLPPRFDCRGRNWPEDPGACVVEHLRKNDVVPESGETVVETPRVSSTVVGRAGFVGVVVLGLGVWVWRRRAAREASNSKPLV